MQLGIFTFGDWSEDARAGKRISAQRRMKEIIKEAVLAEEVGLDIYGVGEHHRAEYLSSAPSVILSAIAAKTSKIRLTSAVTVLSSDDPIRVFQRFSELDLISDGRAEIIAGRGSFIESFPLFGYDLKDYDDLYKEKLELLLKLRDSEKIDWAGTEHTKPIENLGVYPRPVQEELPIWLATGGNPDSARRAAKLGLPLALAIIGGYPVQFQNQI